MFTEEVPVFLICGIISISLVLFVLCQCVVSAINSTPPQETQQQGQGHGISSAYPAAKLVNIHHRKRSSSI
jgi:hypothetical protein